MIQFIAVLLFCSRFLFSQDLQTNLLFPGSVTWNTQFEVALISSVKSPNGKLQIFVKSPDRIDLKKAVLKSLYGSRDLDFTRSNSGWLTEIDLHKVNLPDDVKYQVLFTFRPDNVEKAWIEVTGYYTSGGHQKILFGGDDQLTASVEFYKPQKYAGKALQLNGGEFKFLVNAESHKPMSVDFWFRTPVNDLSIFKINGSSRTLFDIFTNSFGMLSLQSSYLNTELKPAFISSNTWNHIAVMITDINVDLYCNGLLVAANQVNTLPGILEFSFGGNPSKEYLIDQLNICRIEKNEIFRILGNRNFTSPPTEAQVIKSLKFDGEIGTSMNNGVAFSASRIKYVRSDAPLGLKSPDLNINIYSSTIDLEWSGGDYKHASEYILEKSENNEPFSAVHSVSAYGDEGVKYHYTDVQNRNSEIVYYRVRQILKDGSSVYSSQVKVGQGYSEPFMLGQNFPNPFNPRTTIDIELFRDSDLEVLIFDLAGKEVARLFNGNLHKGKHEFSFDGSELPSGVYLCRVITPDYSQTTKMILTK